jgi:hypothetical protein
VATRPLLFHWLWTVPANPNKNHSSVFLQFDIL